MKSLGVALIVIGLIACVLPLIPFTRKEKALDIGPLQVTTEKQEHLSISPLLGITAMAIGGAIVVASIVTKK